MASLTPRSTSMWSQCQSIRSNLARSHQAASHTTPLCQQSRRHETTYRRQVQRNHLPPAPGFLPKTTGNRSSHIVFNPPASSPNVYHTPLKFLPRNDRRRQLYESAAQSSSMYTTTSHHRTASPIQKPGTALHEASSTLPSSFTPQLPSHAKSLPSPLDKIQKVKKYHLGEEEIAEIRKLRLEDPFKWTRIALAKRFECSEYFVSLVQKSPEAARVRAEEQERAKGRWGRTKTLAREDRTRRKALWGRDA